MDDIRIYYLAPKGSKVLESIKIFELECSTIHDRWDDYRGEYGAESLTELRNRIGLIFDQDEAPYGWLKTQNNWVPNNRCKKVRYAAIRRDHLPKRPLPQALALRLSKQCNCPAGVPGKRQSTIQWLSYEKVGDKTLISVHERSAQPTNLVKIDSQEYLNLTKSVKTQYPFQENFFGIKPLAISSKVKRIRGIVFETEFGAVMPGDPI